MLSKFAAWPTWLARRQLDDCLVYELPEQAPDKISNDKLGFFELWNIIRGVKIAWRSFYFGRSDGEFAGLGAVSSRVLISYRGNINRAMFPGGSEMGVFQCL